MRRYSGVIPCGFNFITYRCWSDDSLSRIGSAIRVSEFADECNSTQKRIQYARMMVEMDVIIPLVNEVTIDIRGFKLLTQKVKFEFKPKFA